MRHLCPTRTMPPSLRAHLKMGMKDVASFEHDGVAHAVFVAFAAPGGAKHVQLRGERRAADAHREDEVPPRSSIRRIRQRRCSHADGNARAYIGGSIVSSSRASCHV